MKNPSVIKKKLQRLLPVMSMSLGVVSTAWAVNPLITPIPLPAITQNAMHYLPNQANTPILSSELQHAQAQRTLRLFFGPWSEHAVNARSLTRAEQELVAYLGNPAGHYAYNFHAVDQRWVAQLAQDMRGTTFGAPRAAIIVNNTPLRALPTELPIYSNFHAAGAGYPFDLLQLSAEWVGKPVVVFKLTQDSAWALISDGDVEGWVKTADLAYVTADDQATMRQASFVAITQDNTPIKDAAGHFLFYAKIGMLFPAQAGKILVPVRSEQGNASFMWVPVTTAQAQPFPLAATPHQIALLINQMLGQPYAWGGLYNLRDCSLTMKSLLLPFGIDLPRNSQDQADAGHKLSLAHLSDQAKQALLASKGVPFMTLLHMHGHIVLYLGSVHGDGIIFQNKWGLATVDQEGHAGRAVLGQAHIAPLSFGKDVPNAATTFIKSVDSMTVLP